MSKVFRAPRIRLPRIRLPRIRLPRIRLPRIRLPRPRIRLPRPRIRLPRIRLPRIRVRRFRVRFRSRRWGKKKRSVDAITDSYDSVSDLQLRDTVEECMARCSTCEPFLGQPNEIVDSICGKKLLEQNETISRTVRKLEKLADHVIQEENNQLVVSVEYDPITYDPNQGGFTGVFVNAYFESGFRTFQSKIPYKLSANSDTAALLAAEYWKEFMKPWTTSLYIISFLWLLLMLSIP